MNQSQTDPTPDELFVSDNEQFAKEERMYFCRETAVKLLAASYAQRSFHLSYSEAWHIAEELWNAKPEHL